MGLPSLPIFQQLTQNSFSLLQTSWKAALTPVIQNELNQGILLDNISLVIGNNKINHLLTRMQKGWLITDINGAATIYRSAPLNDQTLTLNSTAAVVVSIWVF